MTGTAFPQRTHRPARLTGCAPRLRGAGAAGQGPRRRSGLRPKRRGAAARVSRATLAAAWFALAAAAGAGLPPDLDPAPLRAVVVQHDGRHMPLDTLARDVVWRVTGHPSPGRRDPVLLLLAWTFDGAAWQHEPLVPIPNPSLRRELRLPAGQSVFSYADLVEHQPFIALLGEVEALPAGARRDPLQQKVSAIADRLVALQQAFRGEAIRLLPRGADPQARWGTVAELLEDNAPEHQPLRQAWKALGDAFLAGDPDAFAEAAARVATAAEELPAAARPSAAAIACELQYNRLRLQRTAWVLLAAGTALAGAGLISRRRRVGWPAALATFAGTGALSASLALRWVVAGRIPAANMFESMLFLSWGAAAFASLAFLAFRQRLVPFTAVAIGAASLCLADVLPMDPFVRPAAPVLLDTVWMSVHVPVIMVSYALLAIAVLVAHLQAVAAALLPPGRPLVARLDRLLYGYILAGSLLLFLGIVTGSMWAAASWGRYWGWDPKEVWSLVALLGYLAIIHARLPRPSPASRALLLGGMVLGLAVFGAVALRFAPLGLGETLAFAGVALAAVYFALARGPFATAAKSIAAFWLVLMTYVGVNYVLGIGLHSYGFGVGAVAGRLCLFGAADLALVVLLAAVEAARRRLSPAASP